MFSEPPVGGSNRLIDFPLQTEYEVLSNSSTGKKWKMQKDADAAAIKYNLPEGPPERPEEHYLLENVPRLSEQMDIYR